jgi:hypothetical protein
VKFGDGASSLRSAKSSRTAALRARNASGRSRS